MDASGRDLSETYLRGLFEPGEVREVLGMRLVNDPERGESAFRKRRTRMRHQVFVADPGPLAESIGLKDLARGDALWIFRDDIARFREMHIENTATFVAGAAERHHPRAPTGVCFVSGSDRPGGPPLDWTGCRSIRVPEAEVARLRPLAVVLRAYAAEHRLPLPLSREHYEGGPYWLHILRRRATELARRGLRPGPHIIAERPVHEQYWWRLMCELSCVAPCDIVVAAEGERIRFERFGRDGGQRAHEVADAMEPYQFGSARWLLRMMRTWAQRSVDRPVRCDLGANCMRLRVRMLPRRRARLTAMEGEPNGTEQPRPACRARPTPSARLSPAARRS